MHRSASCQRVFLFAQSDLILGWLHEPRGFTKLFRHMTECSDQIDEALVRRQP